MDKLSLYTTKFTKDVDIILANIITVLHIYIYFFIVYYYMVRKSVRKNKHKKQSKSTRGGMDKGFAPSWMSDVPLSRSRSSRNNRQPSSSTWDRNIPMSRRRNNSPRLNSRQPSSSTWGRNIPMSRRRNNSPRLNSRQPSSSTWGRNAPKRNTIKKSTGAYVPPSRRSNATQVQRMGAVPTNNKTIKTDNIINTMGRLNTRGILGRIPKGRKGQGGDSYIDYTNRLDAENIHNHSAQLEYPHHHLSSAHFKPQRPGYPNYPSFRGHVKLRTTRGDYISLSVRISNDDVLMLYLNDENRIFRLENMNANIKQKLEQEPRYRRLDIDRRSEDKLLNYIDKTKRRHYLLQESIKQLV